MADGSFLAANYSKFDASHAEI